MQLLPHQQYKQQKDLLTLTIQSLVDHGIIGGYANGKFKPFTDVTRGLAAKIAAGLLKLDTTNVDDPKFTDLSPNDEY